MELQSRPEALAVELARHQNGDLKKQLHERQPRIAALSDKQVSELELSPTPRCGTRVAGHWGGTLQSAGLGAARSDSQRSLSPASELPAPPFLERKSRVPGGRAGSARLRRWSKEGGCA
ncbi:PHD finger protein 21B-like [Diceros bicornis minor]|uniref:PHD finger protein 21B-like n=1 Tax=Diceros bicornis minor TaxID=77932 RepID=UPI0026EF0670|nr:PHD finger protein 21B-like [Diceros bicornis minor]